MPASPHPIVLFDGVCNFCNATVNFIIDHDPQAEFRFVALQSPLGAELRQRHGIAPDLDSLVLIEADRAYTQSTAALRIARKLSRPWPLATALRLIPRPLRDFAYRQFAARRYSLFGRSEVCRVPSLELRARFLDVLPGPSASR